ncbi:aminopeptidase P family protein [Fretibacter rubidus]|uniref:aminopeptidase P family protein n=1 Tax=Fretibacter rubidus TaxID=570162 RepID=UPI00352B9291
MFQNFLVQGGPDFGQRNLPKLRAELSARGLDGFLVPHEDEYQNEYLPDCNERLMWVSGFTGSAGAAVVMADKAAVFVDGRYTIQLAAQVDADMFDYKRLEDNGVVNWLLETVSAGQKIGYDPKLHATSALNKLRKAVEKAGGALVAQDSNPIDTAWADRPAPPVTPVVIQPLDLAGEDHPSKRTRIAADIKDKGADAAVITAPASIAWLLNIRGGDVQCTPLPLSTAIIKSDGRVDLFINPAKLSDPVRVHLGNQVSLYEEDALAAALSDMTGQTVLVDPNVSSNWYVATLESAGAKVLSAQDPVALPKACKNSAEIAGTTEAHKRDGAALVEFLYWLDTTAQSGHVDEIDAATELERARAATGVLKDLSFETISGAGSNGAIVHYRVSEATTKKLSPGSLFLVDSGGQYVDGTTDVTRTVPIGTPTDEMAERFTLVLKGHIALATVRFPKGTTGSNLDALARMALWAKGLDYDHGTGHGVGAFLGVHEGPQRISKAPNSVALKPGMIVSNEPGYYKTDGYGIRIENLQYVHAPTDIEGGERPMMGFKTLTLAPLHRALIKTDMLSAAEHRYIDDYHASVWDSLKDRVDGDVLSWLEASCQPLA